MERLTMRNLHGKAFARGEHPGEAQPAVHILPELLEILAKYEDTGLTPEEISKLDSQRKAMAALADLYKAEIPQWIPVTERLPDNKKCVLMYSPDGGVAEGCFEESRKRWVQWRWSIFDVPNVTHWMPLPEPPKEVTP